MSGAFPDGLSVPGKGKIAPSGAGDRSLPGVVKGFRPGPPAQPEPQGDGLIVALSAIDGFTDPAVLKKPFYFQCSPLDQMPQDYSWEWNDYTTISSGYHSNPQAPALASWSFETLFVDNDREHWFTLTKDQNPVVLCAALKALGDSMSPFQLQFGQPDLWGTWDVVTGATFRALHIEERAGEPDARYVAVTFSEFTDTPDVQPIPPPPHVRGAHNKGQQPKLPAHILAILDSSTLHVGSRTMTQLAKRYYGSAAAWRLIAKASGLTSVGPNTDLTTMIGKHKPPGKVVVPRKPRTEPTPQTKKRRGR